MIVFTTSKRLGLTDRNLPNIGNLNNGFLSHGIQDDFGTNFDNFSEGNSQSAIFERNYRNFCRKRLKLREINSLFRLYHSRKIKTYLSASKPRELSIAKWLVLPILAILRSVIRESFHAAEMCLYFSRMV